MKKKSIYTVPEIGLQSPKRSSERTTGRKPSLGKRICQKFVISDVRSSFYKLLLKLSRHSYQLGRKYRRKRSSY